MTSNEFKQRLLSTPAEDITRDVLLTDDAAHLTPSDHAYMRARFAEMYGTNSTEVRLWCVGSAKLGFSLIEKRHNGSVLPRYRPYNVDSDIDIAIVSPLIFSRIWADLSSFANRATRLPWDSGKLGDYLVHGWLRPDRFPNVRLTQCDRWWDLIRSLSGEARFNRHRVRGGLFYSYQDLAQYQARAVVECRQALELSA